MDRASLYPRHSYTSSDFLVFTGQTGSTTHLPDTLLIAIDETGDPRQNDMNNPVYGIGGIATLTGMYVSTIHSAWQKMKRQAFPNIKGPMHAKKHLRNIKNKRSYKHLCDFYAEHDFASFAVYATPQTKRPSKDVDVAHLIELMYTKVLPMVAIPYHGMFRSLLLIVEEGAQHQPRMREFTETQFKLKIGDVDNVRIDMAYMSKQEAFPALEIADQVLYAATQHVKHHEIDPKYDTHLFDEMIQPPNGNTMSAVIQTIGDT